MEQSKVEESPKGGLTANQYSVNPYLVYGSRESCVEDQTGKGVSDPQAKTICSIMRMHSNNAATLQQHGIFSANVAAAWETEEFYVIPLTATSEGVQNGAYKSQQELQKGFPHFENTPLCIMHPPGRGVMGLDEVAGWVRDTEFDAKDASWKGNAYFIKDSNRLKEMGHDEEGIAAQMALIEALRAGARLDGSIGYFHDTLYEAGTYKGVPYDRQEVNIMVDHFAVVDRGASDWHMGTGFGLNEKAEDACCGDCADTGGSCTDAPTANDHYASKSPYDGRYQDKGAKGQPSRTWTGYTDDGDHTHTVWATHGHDAKGERITVYIMPAAEVAPENPHRHEWDGAKNTTSDEGHTHALPEDFHKWVAAWAAYHSAEPEPEKGFDGPAVVRHRSRIYDYVFSRGKARQGVPAYNRAEAPPILASLLNHAGRLKTQENISMKATDALVVKALSLNQLAELHPEVAKTLAENKRLQGRNSALDKRAQAAISANRKVEADLKAAKTRLNRFEVNARKVTANERKQLITDIVSVTGRKPEAYRALGINALKATHDAITRAAKFGANAVSKNAGEMEAKHEEEELMEGLGSNEEGCEDDMEYNMDDDDYAEDGDDEEEDYFSEDTELDVELDGAGASKKDIERPDQGDPYKMQDKPTGNRKAADRTPLASRIRQGLQAPTANAKQARAKAQKAPAQNKAKRSTYEQIAFNHQSRKGGKN